MLVELRKLPEPATLGPYTVYVLWAITMEGRATNLGFFELRSGRAELNTSVPLAQIEYCRRPTRRADWWRRFQACSLPPVPRR